MNQLSESAGALWQRALQLDVEAWLLIVVVLIFLQLLRVGRAARRSARHVREARDQLAETNDRVGMLLDRMVDAEERLLGLRITPEVPEEDGMAATGDGDDDTERT